MVFAAAVGASPQKILGRSTLDPRRLDDRVERDDGDDELDRELVRLHRALRRLRAQLVAEPRRRLARLRAHELQQRGAACGAGGRGAVRGVRRAVRRAGSFRVKKRRAPLGGARQRYAVHSAQYGACSAHSSARRVARRALAALARARGSSGSASAQKAVPASPL